MEDLTYQSSGVNIDEATEALADIKDVVRATYTDNVLSDIGAFGGMFAANFPGIREPVLVASIDGVGSKTSLARTMEQYEGLGADLVNHSVNDILAQGAKPLFFLDYFGTSKLDKDQLTAVIRGVAKACKAVGCVLIGGETAEIPDIYAAGHCEISGSIVGVVDKAKRLPRSGITAGNVVIGLASTGLHTNGYTLARKALFDKMGCEPDRYLDEVNGILREALLAEHRCYFSSVYPLLPRILAIAHITGGGLLDNIPRVLPEGCAVELDRTAWKEPAIFGLLRQVVPENEMYRAFNCGIGMALIVHPDSADGVNRELNDRGEWSWIIGNVVEGQREVKIS